MREGKDAAATVSPAQIEEGTVATVSQGPNKKSIERTGGPTHGDPGGEKEFSPVRRRLVVGTCPTEGRPATKAGGRRREVGTGGPSGTISLSRARRSSSTASFVS